MSPDFDVGSLLVVFGHRPPQCQASRCGTELVCGRPVSGTGVVRIVTERSGLGRTYMCILRSGQTLAADGRVSNIEKQDSVEACCNIRASP